MSTVENISGMLMVIAVSIFILIFVALSLQEESELSESNALYQKKYSMTDTMFSTLLLLTEPQSEMQFNVLLGTFFYERSDEIQTPYGTYNIHDTLGNMLDYYFGEGKYYFEAYPLINDVRLYFVIDGSNTMQPMRDYLKTELPTRLDQIRQQYDNVIAKVYILSDDPSLCNGFPASMPCEVVNDMELYDDNDARVTDPFAGVNTPMFPKQVYASSDWASGSAYASFHNNQFSPSRIELIIPISDEVALGTKEDICYTAPNNDLSDSLWKIACFYCTPKSDYATSDDVVDTATTVIQDYKQIVMPINALKADYEEAGQTYTYLEQHFGGPPDDSEGSTFCSDTNCKGCIDCSNCNSQAVCTAGNCPGCPAECDPAKAYWHPEGFQELNRQFYGIAQATNGRNYTIDDFDEMIAYIDSTISTFVNSLELKIGAKREGTYVGFSKVIPHPLANDAYMEVRFRYYEEELYDMQSHEYDIAPVIQSYNLDMSNPSTYHFDTVIKDDNHEVKVILTLNGSNDVYTAPTNHQNTVETDGKFYHTYDADVPTAGLGSPVYNLSLDVEDEEGRTYEFKGLQIGVSPGVVCGCDVTAGACDSGCGCDPDCAGAPACSCDATSGSCDAGCPCDADCVACSCDATAGTCEPGCGCDPDCGGLPEHFFWHNRGGSAWDVDDGTDYLPPVRNQGACGSCWAFGTIGSTEGRYNVEQDSPGYNLDLAEQDLVSCASPANSHLNGCSGASGSLGMQQARDYVVDEGVPLETAYPYSGTESACAGISADYTVDTWSYVSSNDINEWKRGLINEGPMLALIAMSDWLSPPVGSCIGASQDHAVVIVGYDADGWIIRNSFGPMKPNHHRGYFKVLYGDCGIDQYYPDYPINVQGVP